MNVKKRKLFLLLISVLLFSVYVTNARAEEDVKKEEAEGRKIWEKLQSKERICSDLSDDDFEKLGEYFMGQMLQESHAEMNRMMSRMMGEDGEEQIHIAMGKRLSGCDVNAEYPRNAIGFMPMMNMMGGWSGLSGFNTMMWPSTMMWNFGGGAGWLGAFFAAIIMILFWAVAIAVLIFLIKWIISQFKGTEKKEEKTSDALEILKSRYAKGEISREEFESKKKDIF